MFKKLKLLLSLRSWVNSKTLQAGGVVGVLTALDAFLKSETGMSAVDLAAGLLHLSSGTLYDLVLAIVSVGMLGLRAHTEWSLTEKNMGMHK